MKFSQEQLDKVKTVLGLIDDGKPTLADLKKLVALLISAVKETAKQLNSKIDARLALIKDGKDGLNGRDGKDGVPGPRGERGEPGQSIVGPAGSDGSPDMAEDIRNKLELLTGDERLKMEAILGLEEMQAEIDRLKARPTGGFGGRALLQLLVNGAKKNAIQYLNFVAGDGVTLTYDRANGRNDVIISAAGGEGGSFDIIAVTGTIDDSNTSFMAASAPKVVVVSGASYRDGHGCTISGTSITLDNPVGTGGDIYAL